MDQHNHHKNSEREEQTDKPFVVAVAQTIVNKDTVVIEFLDTPVAEIAMVRILRP